MNIVLSILPNATDSINRLKDKPESLQKKGQQVKSNIESLQKKINICRDMVNRYVLNFPLFRLHKNLNYYKTFIFSELK